MADLQKFTMWLKLCGKELAFPEWVGGLPTVVRIDLK